MTLAELNMVTDRTINDVDYWRSLQKKGYAAMTDEEKAVWNSGTMKGAYNVSDLNRVGTALNYLRESLADAGYIDRHLFVAKTDWTVTDIPTADDLSKYLTYVSRIRNATVHFPDTPLTPAGTGTLNYNNANDIEKILLASEYILENIRAIWFFCDDLYCGEV
jgi:hypothetical protein